MKEWILDNYLQVLAALGLGGGGGILSKKLLDNQQNEEINQLKKRMKVAELTLTENKLLMSDIANKIETNTLFDKQFRDEMTSQRTELARRLKGLEEGQTKMFDYIVEIFKDKK